MTRWYISLYKKVKNQINRIGEEKNEKNTLFNATWTNFI